MPADARLRTQSIRVRFGEFAALDGVSLEVGDAEIVGLIGPNGAGKTTLLDAMCGNLRSDEGRVFLLGSDVSDLAPSRRAQLGLGRSYQDARLFPGLCVRDAIQLAFARQGRVGFASALLGTPWARAAERTSRSQADELIEQYGLAPWATALISELSTGTRRACDLVMQLATGAKVLLLDEPTAGIAQADAVAVGPLLRRVRDEVGCSMLIVAHDMPLLRAVASRVYAMDAGQIIAEGTPDEISRDPQVVARYLGHARAGHRVAADRGAARLSGRPGDELSRLGASVLPQGTAAGDRSRCHCARARGLDSRAHRGRRPGWQHGPRDGSRP